MQQGVHALEGTRSASQLFTYPFRIFFLSLAVQAALFVPLWVLLITGTINLPLALPPMVWHQHEFVFALLHAGIAGFLLTAVCVWTGTERTHGLSLFALWLVWLAGRVLLLAGVGLPEWLVVGVSLGFLPLVMVDVGWRVLRARQYRQLIIMVVLGLLWLMQLGYLLTPLARFADAALMVAVALMLVVGGRITPNFSMGWLRQRGLPSDDMTSPPALDYAGLAGVAVTLAALLTDSTGLLAIAAAITGCLALARIACWRGWRVRREPLLWILHLSLLWIPAALWLLAGSALGWWSATVWVHAAGAGAMGGLILGVMSRVALGHTGRPLNLPAGMVSAFVLIHLGALLRVATGLEFLPWRFGVSAAAVCWTVAFGLFLFRYTGILMAPRADGRPG